MHSRILQLLSLEVPSQWHILKQPSLPDTTGTWKCSWVDLVSINETKKGVSVIVCLHWDKVNCMVTLTLAYSPTRTRKLDASPRGQPSEYKEMVIQNFFLVTCGVFQERALSYSLGLICFLIKTALESCSLFISDNCHWNKRTITEVSKEYPRWSDLTGWISKRVNKMNNE